jgi:hydrogenase-4 component F
MTLVITARHIGLMWVAVEATTLASAPLIHFHRHHRSLEAAWKYLVICSVGIAIALLGNFFLVVATGPVGKRFGSITISELMTHARELDPRWLKAAFLLLLVGYGTKIGLAPLHAWLPDAHSEAPSVVSALLSGALLNCAFLAILRIHAVCEAAGLGDFSKGLFLLFGVVSMAVAAVFIVGQSDYKRMLAYSSVEHMGIAMFGVGLGGIAGFGALLHVVNHSLAKAMLFLLAEYLAAYRRTLRPGHGVLRLPVTAFYGWRGSRSRDRLFGLFVSELDDSQQILTLPTRLRRVQILLLTVLVGSVVVLRWPMGIRPLCREPAPGERLCRSFRHVLGLTVGPGGSPGDPGDDQRGDPSMGCTDAELTVRGCATPSRSDRRCPAWLPERSGAA